MEENLQREFQLTRMIFSISLLVSILLALIVTLDDFLFIRVLFGLILFFIVSLILMSMLRQVGRKTGLFLSLAVLNALLLIPEMALRLADFRYEHGIQFGYPRPSQFVRLQMDPDLFWRLNPSYPGVNKHGFPGDEFTIPKPENTFRIIYLGDSTTVQGYPIEVERLLNASPTKGLKDYESLSLAVYGYSSYQGRILTDMYGESLEPDLVVVFYGWNDHWLAFGAKDSQKKILISSTTQFYIALHQSRLAQWLFWLSDTVSGAQSDPIDEVRVPLEEYRENLQEIQEKFTQKSIPLLLITAPTTHYRLGVPDYLVEMKFVRNKETAKNLHYQYNEVVREMAQNQWSYLLDLEAEFNSLPKETLQTIFMEDGIHFTPDGVLEVATRITQFIEQHIVRTPLSPPK